jgi:hypothetical protein
MKLNDFRKPLDSYYNQSNGRYFYSHPHGKEWDVIMSPSPRGHWNTNNISVAVATDLRIANLLAYTMSKIEIER